MVTRADSKTEDGNATVAIVGLAHRLPGAKGEPLSSAALWQALMDGEDLVSCVDSSRWSIEPYCHPRKSEPGTSYTFAAGSVGEVFGFDAGFFGISPREAQHMEPQQRLLLELCWEAFENAGIRPSSVRGSDWGVYLGLSAVDHSYRIADDLAAVAATTMTGNAASIAANRISYVFDLRGPSMVLDTACSSSLVAFHQACQSIRSGESAAAVVGGVSLHLHPYGFIGFSKASMLSPQGRCRVFDKDGDGYVRSEGGAIVLLKPLQQALADGNLILAVVAATGVNTDGHKNGLTVPSPAAQARLLRQVSQKAGIGPDDFDYLEAHGTGTAVGDPIETRALSEAIGQLRTVGPLPIGSVKSNLGHLEAASGMAGLVKVLLAIQHRCVPPMIHLETPHPLIPFEEWKLTPVRLPLALPGDQRVVLGINSFGFGGSNAHAILTSFEAAPSVSEVSPSQPTGPPLVLSARSEGALRQLASRMAEQLRDRPDECLYDVAYSAVFHREAHPLRLLVQAADSCDLANKLTRFADSGSGATGVLNGNLLPRASAAAFVYSGNGSQWPGMGERLLREDEVFAGTIEEVDAWFRAYSGPSILTELRTPTPSSRLHLTEIAQPALFAIQVAFTRMLHEQGIHPGAVCGHSVGEITAAWAAGAISLSQAVRIVHERSRHQARTRGSGQMTAVALGPGELQAVLVSNSFSDRLTLASLNSSRSTTVAGDCATLAELEALLDRNRIAFRRLSLDYPFHCAAMDAIRTDLERSLSRSPALEPQSSRIPFFSTVTGALLAGGGLDVSYWWRNVREAVRFGEAVDAMIDTGVNVFVEIGPEAILRRYLDECVHDATRRDPDYRAVILSTMNRKDGGVARIERIQQELLLVGAPLDTSCVFPVRGRFVDLPHYPWQRERHCLGPTPESLGLLSRREAHPLLGYAVAAEAHLWENHLDTRRVPALADHAVGETVIFPAAGFVEMALAAGLEWEPSGSFSLEDLEILAPLLLSHERSKTTRTRIDAADGRFTIVSRERLAADPWTVNASGRLVRAPLATRSSALVLPQRMVDVTAERHYQLANTLGLHYGPAFRSVASVWMSEDSAVALLSAPGPAAFQPDTLALDPTQLDGAFQLLMDIVARTEPESEAPVFLPAQIGRLQVLTPHRRARYAQATLTRRSRRSLVCDFALYDESGAVIAAARGVRFRAVSIRRAAVDSARLYAMRAVPMPRVLPPRRPDLPPLHDFVMCCARRLHHDERQVSRRQYAEEVEPLLDVLCATYAEHALRRLGGESESIATESLIASAVVAPEARFLLDWLLEMVAEQGALEQVGERWVWRERVPSLKPEDIWATLVFDYPQYAALTGHVGSAGLRLEATLRSGAVAVGESGEWSPWAVALTQKQVSDIARALADAVQVACATQAPGSRLRVLCFLPAIFSREVALTPGLDLDRCDFVMATAHPRDDLDGLLRRRRPQLVTTQIDLDAVSAGDSQGLGEPFDLILLSNELVRSTPRLQSVHALLAGNGMLVVVEHFPSRPVDFICRAERLQSEASRFTLPRTWHEAMKRAGFIECETLADLAEGSGSTPRVGPYLVFARRSGACEKQHGTIEQPARTWLVLRDEAGASGKLGERLERELHRRGQRVVSVFARSAYGALAGDRFALDPGSREHWCQLIEALRYSGQEPAGWIHLMGLSLGSKRVPLALRERRVGALVSWLQASAGLGVQPDTFVVAARAGSALLPDAQTGMGQPGRPMGQQNDALLWGVTRVAVNEHPDMRIRWIDLTEPDSSGDAAKLALEVLEPDAEDEVLLTREGRYVPRLGFAQSPEPTPARAKMPGLRLELPVGESVEALAWRRCEFAAPGPGQVQIEVRAAGLNFRDVMYAMGLLPEEALESGFAGSTLGMEVSGMVTLVGPGVSDIAPGDEVIAFAPAAFSNRVITNASAVVRKPADWSFEAAATIPTAFFTAYYALHELARVRPGERVLIHGAAGGVGLAAIQVAKHLGVEVFATAGTPEKRDFVRLLGVRHVFDSRTLAFAEEILSVTCDEGVDVIVNSLAGEAINRNLSILRPFGRLIELGKRDFYANTRIGLRPFRHNVSYFAVDADQLMVERPDLTPRILTELLALFASGVLHPLPYRTFDASEVVEAFRYMRESRQIGKVVIELRPDFDPDDLASVPASRGRESVPNFPGDATYLVSGGLSGFGLRTAQWLAERGARHLVLLSRRGAVEPEARAALDELERRGIQVAAPSCDVSDKTALAGVLASVRARMPPLRGVIHAAMVMDDTLIRNLTLEKLRRVLAPKVVGAANLDYLTRRDALDFFVLYSSATTLFGNPGQAAYVAANMALEALSRERRARGAPASSILWGPLRDAGYLADNASVREALEARLGGRALAAADALTLLGRILTADDRTADLAIFDADWGILGRHLPAVQSPRFSETTRGAELEPGQRPPPEDLRRWLDSLDTEELFPALVDVLKQEIGAVLRIAPEALQAGVSLQDAGMDSLMVLELSVALDRRLGVRLPELAFAAVPTVERLAQRIIREWRPEPSLPGEPPPPADGLPATVRVVAARHAGDLSEAMMAGLSAKLLESGPLAAQLLPNRDGMPGADGSGAHP